jgi:hypothetical protein
MKYWNIIITHFRSHGGEGEKVILQKEDIMQYSKEEIK